MTKQDFPTILSPEKDQVCFNIARRLTRLRKNHAVRALVQETCLRPEQLIQPVFVTEGPTQALESIPGIFRFQLSDLLQEVESILASRVRTIHLFCQTMHQKGNMNKDVPQTVSLMARSIKALKSSFPELLIFADVGADCYIDRHEEGALEHLDPFCTDKPCSILGELALAACEAGADFILTSDLFDGRVGYLRNLLDRHSFHSTGIVACSVTFDSHLYEPFREAVKEPLRYLGLDDFHVNHANTREALFECRLDEMEWADMLMIRPAILCLDILVRLRSETLLPIGAYQVSGEWAMIQAASERGWINKDKVLLESLLAIRRAGADFIFSYGAKRAAELLSHRG